MLHIRVLQSLLTFWGGWLLQDSPVHCRMFGTSTLGSRSTKVSSDIAKYASRVAAKLPVPENH